MLPLVLNLRGRLSVVIGGGTVGRRKAHAVLAAGGRVRLVCLEPRPGDETSPRLEWLTEPYAPHHLDGAALVFAAATDVVNRLVITDARARGILVNAATAPEESDFHLPAMVRRGDLLLAVSTGGASPVLAREIRRRLEQEFDDALGRWVALLAEMRPIVLAAVADEATRRAVFERMCGWGWLDRLRREGEDAVRAALLAEVQRLAGTKLDPL